MRKLGAIRTGAGAKSRKGFAGRLLPVRGGLDLRYSDGMALPEYLSFLYERLAEIHRSSPDRVRLRTPRFSRRSLCEAAPRRVVRARAVPERGHLGLRLRRPARDRWPKKHDNILWYSKSAKWTFNIDDIDRVPYMAPGLVGPEKAARGKLPTDTWWLTIVPTNGAERTGYPTQKPLKLLERVVRASSNPGDLVADFFCGSGTTGVAAKKLGRRYLLVDDNPDAIRITNERLAP